MIDHEDTTGGTAVAEAPATSEALAAQLASNGEQRARLTECAGKLDEQREETKRARGAAIDAGAPPQEVAQFTKRLRAIADEREGITEALELLSDRRRAIEDSLAAMREQEASDRLTSAIAAVDALFQTLEEKLVAVGREIVPLVQQIRAAGEIANQAHVAHQTAMRARAQATGEPMPEWNPVPPFYPTWPGRSGLRDVVDLLLQPTGVQR